MSRSYKKHQFNSITTAESDKEFKVANHQVTRAKAKTELNEVNKLPDDEVADITGRELTNFKRNNIDQWDSPKESKCFCSQSELKQQAENANPPRGTRTSSWVASPSSKTKTYKLRK